LLDRIAVPKGIADNLTVGAVIVDWLEIDGPRRIIAKGRVGKYDDFWEM